MIHFDPLEHRRMMSATTAIAPAAVHLTAKPVLVAPHAVTAVKPTTKVTSTKATTAPVKTVVVIRTTAASKVTTKKSPVISTTVISSVKSVTTKANPIASSTKAADGADGAIVTGNQGATDTLVRPGDMQGVPLAPAGGSTVSGTTGTSTSTGTTDRPGHDNSGSEEGTVISDIPPDPTPPDPDPTPDPGPGPSPDPDPDPNPDPGPDNTPAPDDNGRGPVHDNMPNDDGTGPVGPASLGSIITSRAGISATISSHAFSNVTIGSAFV